MPRKRVELTCQFCGDSFTTYPSRSHQKYCSKDCPGQTVEVDEDFAYFVGLIASDGCLHKDGRRVSFSNTDATTLQWVADYMPRSGMTKARSPVDKTRQVYSNWRRGYLALSACGLTPRKSLTLGAIDLPEPLFPHVLRGVIDGDGGVYLRRGGRYLHITVASGSDSFLSWLRDTSSRVLGVRWSEPRRGSIHVYCANAWSLSRVVWSGRAHMPRKNPFALAAAAGVAPP